SLSRLDSSLRWNDNFPLKLRSKVMSDHTVLVGRRLIDGTGSAPIENPVILVQGSKIAAVGREGEITVPQDATKLDYGDKVLLPGLIDCHVHLCMSADDNPLARLYEDSDDMVLLRAAHNARLALEAGVTTLRDCGGRNMVTFSIREAIEKKIINGPRLMLSGRPITITGGHCFFLNGEADGVDGVRKAARQLIKEGADFLKIMASGGGMTPSTISKLPYYTVEELTVAADEAHRLGRKIAAHCHSTKSIEDVLEVGVDTIEHGSFLSPDDGRRRFKPDIAERIVASGTYVCPTISAGRRPVRPEERTDEYKSRLQTDMKDSRLALMHRAGVKIIAGTDAGVRFTTFDNYPLCLELAVAGGMTNMQAIQSGTGLAAEALGISHIVGTVQPGKEADIIAVDGDPMEDIGALWNVAMVMKSGEPIPVSA
ncbi:amidohydrolase family protein, partial [Candidatus Poribacteria bacterium]